ncbi:hypothetical protein BpHYR1_033508 [Brachionus plicatilis]|uniref:Uncharacterized protein n=1 Tax=Brachionus plicatilis TaxID=10195 RepID=A0A3M7QWI7_BRAPC|nr:hypothetical protein BpHYR1_033508 [Brachionus plicatilis]
MAKIHNSKLDLTFFMRKYWIEANSIPSLNRENKATILGTDKIKSNILPFHLSLKLLILKTKIFQESNFCNEKINKTPIKCFKNQKAKQNDNHIF